VPTGQLLTNVPWGCSAKDARLPAFKLLLWLGNEISLRSHSFGMMRIPFEQYSKNNHSLNNNNDGIGGGKQTLRTHLDKNSRPRSWALGFCSCNLRRNDK
jgi:hypothetical protein